MGVPEQEEGKKQHMKRRRERDVPREEEILGEIECCR